MDGLDRHSALIDALTADLKPVRPALSPWVLCGLFVAAAIVVGAVVTLLTHYPHLLFGAYAGARGGIAIWMPALGATLTALCCAFAAIQSGLPDRSRAWALLPVPAAIFWLGAEIYHGMAAGPGLTLWGDDLAESLKCVRCILLGAAPLAVVALLMLRSLSPLEPGVTALLCGVAAASAGAAILAFAHPHDSAVLDLVLHGATIAAVIALTLGVGRKVLER